MTDVLPPELPVLAIMAGVAAAVYTFVGGIMVEAMARFLDRRDARRGR